MLQDLPELVLDVVWGHLSYEDVLALRCTCKGLKQVVDGKEFTKLNLFVRKFPFHHRLFYTNEPIGYPHSLHSDDLAILGSTRFREQFVNVKQMFICGKESFGLKVKDISKAGIHFTLNSLNHFKCLRHLEITKMVQINGKLNSKELRIVSFCKNVLVGKSCGWKIVLDCPKLRALKIRGRSRPVLTSNTNQLDYLHYYPVCKTNYLKSIRSNLLMLSTICLETIEHSLQFLSDLKTGSLSLPSLVQIRLEYCTDLERLNSLASCLDDLRRDLHTKHIQFTFLGYPISSPDELRQIASQIRAHDSDAHEANQDKFNFKFLKDRSLLFLNGYPELEFLLLAARNVELYYDIQWRPEEVIRKLKSIECLTFRHKSKSSVSTLELFARNCKSLRSLTLYNQTITERLLEVMSKHLVNLESFGMFGFSFRYETLKPLGKFRNLERIEWGLNFNVPKNELTFIFENSRTLESVLIVCKNAIHLKRTTVPKVNNKIMLCSASQVLKFDTLAAMIDYYYEKNLFRKKTKKTIRRT